MEIGAEIVEGHISVNQVSIGIQLLESLLQLVVLVPDLAYQLFQNVLHGHNSQGAAIFVNDHSNVGFVRLEQLEQIVDLLRGMDENGRRNDLLNAFGGDSVTGVKVFLVDHTHHLVDVVFKHQKPREMGLGKALAISSLEASMLTACRSTRGVKIS